MTDDRLERAWQAEKDAKAALDASGGGWFSPENTKWLDAVHARERAMYLAHDCYGAYGKCISCGCSKGKPCVSHQGNPRHQAELLERIAVAAEMAAEKGPDR